MNFLIGIYNILNTPAIGGLIGAAEIGLDIAGFISFVKASIKRDSLNYQLVCVLETTLKNSSKELGWKHNRISKIKIKELSAVFSAKDAPTEDWLKETFNNLAGINLDDRDIQIITKHFNVAVSSYPEVFRYILLQFILLQISKNGTYKKKCVKRETFSRVETHYLDSMKALQFSESISSKTLSETYIPNEYFIGQNDKRDDLILIMNMFMEGEFVEYAKKFIINGNPVDEVNTLIITASQCCGKSSLVAELLYEYTLYARNYSLYVTNFRDENNKRKILSLEMICNMFGIKETQLEDAVLILDSIEESELSAAKIQDMIEILSSELKDYRCRLIVTCRNNYINFHELEGCLELRLCPFSEDKINKWIAACELNIDPERVDKIIKAVKQDFSQVLCLPYIIKICLEKNLIVGNINDLGHLYDKAFIIDADLLYSRYDSHHRLTTRKVKDLKNVILKVAMRCFYAKDRAISKDELKELCKPYDDQFVSVLVSLFLLRKMGDQYLFIHESILNYFVAKKLYDHLSSIKEKNDEDIACYIQDYVKDGFLLPKNVYEFFYHFSKTAKEISTQKAIEIIRSFLSGKYEDHLKIYGNYTSLKQFHYACYVFVMCLSTEIIDSNECQEEYNIVDKLDLEELHAISSLSNMGDADMDVLGIYSLSGITLEGFSFKNTDFTNSRRRIKTIKNSCLTNTNFDGAHLDGMYLINSELTMSSFMNAFCTNIQINKCALRNCNFRNADFRGAIVEGSDISCSDFRGAKLHKTAFIGTNIEKIIIDAEQLKELIDFTPDYIRQNHIRLYKNGCELPDELIEDEFAIQRPAAYQVYIHPEIKKQRTTQCRLVRKLPIHD